MEKEESSLDEESIDNRITYDVFALTYENQWDYVQQIFSINEFHPESWRSFTGWKIFLTSNFFKLFEKVADKFSGDEIDKIVKEIDLNSDMAFILLLIIKRLRLSSKIDKFIIIQKIFQQHIGPLLYDFFRNDILDDILVKLANRREFKHQYLEETENSSHSTDIHNNSSSSSSSSSSNSNDDDDDDDDNSKNDD